MFEGFAQLAAHRRDLLLGGKDDGVGVERGFEVFSAFSELDDADAEGADAFAAEGFGHGACLEGGEVALDRVFGVFQGGLDGGEFFFPVVSVDPGAFECGAGGVVDEVGAFEGVDGGAQDGVVEGVGGEAVGLAAFGALAGLAGVVAVAGGASGGGGADVVALAVVAEDESGEVVVGAVGGSGGDIFASAGEEVLDVTEQLGAHERWVRCGVVAVPEGDLAEVDAVAQ